LKRQMYGRAKFELLPTRTLRLAALHQFAPKSSQNQ
jgi:hypothetical protein